MTVQFKVGDHVIVEGEIRVMLVEAVEGTRVWAIPIAERKSGQPKEYRADQLTLRNPTGPMRVVM